MPCFQACAVEHAKTLLDALARLSEQQLLQFDGLLVVDDVEKGRTLYTPTHSLIGPSGTFPLKSLLRTVTSITRLRSIHIKGLKK